LQRWVRSLTAEQLEKLVGVLEQWNSNRKMASLAQMFLSLLLAAVPPEKLQAIEGMNATCEGLLSYLSRHQARVDALLQKTFVFDLVLQSSGMGLALMDEFNGMPAPQQSSDDVQAGSNVVGAVKEAESKRAEDALKKTMDVLLKQVLA